MVYNRCYYCVLDINVEVINMNKYTDGIDLPKNKECKFTYMVAPQESCYKCHSPFIMKIEDLGSCIIREYFCINPECENH